MIEKRLFQPYSMEPIGPEQLHGLIGKGAKGATAIGDDGFVAGEFRQTLWQFGEGDGPCVGQMPGGKLFGGAHIEQYPTCRIGQGAEGDVLRVAHRRSILAQRRLHGGFCFKRQFFERFPSGVGRWAVDRVKHKVAVSPRFYQLGRF